MKSSFEANYSLQQSHVQQSDENQPKSLSQKDFPRRTHCKLNGKSSNNTPLRSPKTHEALTQLIHLSPSRRHENFTSNHSTNSQSFYSSQTQPIKQQQQQQQQQPNQNISSNQQTHFELASFDSPPKRSRRPTIDDPTHLQSIKKGIVLIKSSEKQNCCELNKSLIISHSPILQMRQTNGIINSQPQYDNKTLPLLQQPTHIANTDHLGYHNSASSVEVIPVKRTIQSNSLNVISCTSDSQSDPSKLNKLNLQFYAGEQQKKLNKVYIGKTLSRKHPPLQDSPEQNINMTPLLGAFSNAEYAENTKTLLESLSKQFDSNLPQQKSKNISEEESKQSIEKSKKERTPSGLSKEIYEGINQKRRGRLNINSSSSSQNIHNNNSDSADVVSQIGRNSGAASPVTGQRFQASSVGQNGFRNKNILKRHHLVRNIRDISQFDKVKKSQLFQFIYESPKKNPSSNHTILKNAHINSALNCIEVFNM